MSKRKRRRCWSKSIGERGCRVRLYEARPGSPIMRSVYLHGREDRRSLGHRDRTRAVREGYALLSALVTNARALDRETLTLGMVEQLYLASPAHRAKKARTQREDAQKLKRVVRFLGAHRDVAGLSPSDVGRYTLARREGSASLIGVAPGRAVANRTIEADIVVVQTALNWAMKERTPHGQRLLRENPLTGVPLPKEKNPRRPVMRHDTYARLVAVASRIHRLLRLALIVAEGTGRRLSAWRNLRWEDVDFAGGVMQWRAAFDKAGYDRVSPVPAAVLDALKAEQRAQRAIGTAPVFPSPRDPSTPCSRHLLDRWLRRAYALAERTPDPGGLWHPLRRKWATERKGYPVKDVAAAGGWRDAGTMLRSYQQADAETMRQVALTPTLRLRGRETHNTTHNTGEDNQEAPQRKSL